MTFRADAAFAKPEVYEALEDRGVDYVIRIPANKKLEWEIADILFRPPGRPSANRWCATRVSAIRRRAGSSPDGSSPKWSITRRSALKESSRLRRMCSAFHCVRSSLPLPFSQEEVQLPSSPCVGWRKTFVLPDPFSGQLDVLGVKVNSDEMSGTHPRQRLRPRQNFYEHQ